jgi:hypothetical protein
MCLSKAMRRIIPIKAEIRLGLSGVACGHWWFLDHEGSSWIDIAGPTEVLNVVESSLRQPVDPDTVLVWLDNFHECSGQSDLVRVTANNLEHGLLHPVTERFADLRHPSQAAFPLGCRRVHIVSDE